MSDPGQGLAPDLRLHWYWEREWASVIWMATAKRERDELREALTEALDEHDPTWEEDPAYVDWPSHSAWLIQKYGGRLGRCICGGAILADTEEWNLPRCYDCWYGVGQPADEPHPWRGP